MSINNKYREGEITLSASLIKSAGNDESQGGVKIGRSWPVRLIALIVFVNGLAAITEVLLTRYSSRLERFLPFDIEYGSRVLGLFTGFVLIYFSIKLYERKRLAWWIAVLGSLVVTTSEAIYTRHAIGLILPVFTFVLLILYRKQFSARSEPTTIAQGIRLLVLSLAVTLLYGTIGFTLLKPHDFRTSRSSTYHKIGVREATQRTLREFVLIGNDDIHPRTRHALWFIDSLDFMGLASLGFAVYSLFRPLSYKLSTLPHERDRARILLDNYGESSEDAFKLWPEDKSYYFSPTGRSFLAYRVASGTAFVLSEPTGLDIDFTELLDSFRRYCVEHDWLVAFIYVKKASLQLYLSASMRIIKIGEDAMIDTRHFMDETGRNKHFRGVRNKFERKQYAYEYALPPHNAALLTELRSISRAWLKQLGRQERGFALGYFDRAYMARSPLSLVRDENGRILAFANHIKSYDKRSASIDLMRHRPNIETGTMDWLFLSIIENLSAQDVAQFNLGLAPLSGVGQDASGNIEERILGSFYDSRFGGFAFAGLRRFKDKFEPNWTPMYLAYQPGPTSLTRLAIGLRKLLG